MEETIFTKIIKGEVPCHKVYEDDTTFAFMDIHPIQPGQVLVVSKTAVAHVWNLNDEEYTALMATVKKIGERIRSMYKDKSHVGVIIEGLEVPHVHVKVFPFNTDQEFHNHPDPGAEPDHATLAEIAKKLTF